MHEGEIRKKQNRLTVGNASSQCDDNRFITKKQGSAQHLLEYFMNTQPVQEVWKKLGLQNSWPTL